MNLAAIRKLVARMRDELSPGGGRQIHALATEYHQHCEEARQRLDQCCAMLDKGNEYQALQLAETEPALPDVLMALSFAERAQWNEQCRNSQLPVPLPFDPAKIKAMDAMYRRGISSAHPLYREYRGAVSKRDDAAALRTIRTIARLNPSDASARSELDRLEEKRVRECAASLQFALGAGDHQAVAALTDELESITSETRLASLPEYARGLAIRADMARKRALERLRDAVASLPGLQSGGDWRKAAALLGSIAGDCREHGFAVPADLEETVGHARAWVAEEDARAARAAEFQSRMTEALTAAEEVERSLAARSLTPQTAADALESLLSRWDAVLRCQLPVLPEHQLRMESVAASLRQEVERMRRHQRTVLFAAAAAAITALGSAAWAGFSYHNASQMAAALATMQTERKVDEAARLVAKVRGPDARLASWAGLAEAAARADSWLATEQARLASAEALVAAMEAGAASQFSDKDAATLRAELAGLGESIALLAPCHLPALETRLAAVRNAADARFTALRSERLKASESLLRKTEEALAALTLQSPPETIRATLADGSASLQSLAAMNDPAADETERLSEALSLRLRQATAAADNFKAQLSAFDAANAALAGSTSLDQFGKALEQFRNVTLGAAIGARAAADAVPDAVTVLGHILYQDEARRESLRKRQQEKPLHPAVVLKNDLATLISLQDDENLNNVYSVTLKRAGTTVTIYAKGKPRPTDDATATVGAAPVYSGNFYRPAPGDTATRFLKGTIPELKSGETIEAISLSPASQFMESLGLATLTDPSGDSYTGDLLTVFTKLAVGTQFPVSLRSYLWSRLAPIALRDPEGWGLHLAPTLAADLNRSQSLGEIAAGSSAWMLPDGSGITAAHRSFFASLQNRAYKGEAVAASSIESTVMAAGLQFAGHADATGSLVLLPAHQEAPELWFLDRAARTARLIRQNISTAKPQPVPPPFAPVFVIPIDRLNLIRKSNAARQREAGPFFTES
jgi:hypothetical protein